MEWGWRIEMVFVVVGATLLLSLCGFPLCDVGDGHVVLRLAGVLVGRRMRSLFLLELLVWHLVGVVGELRGHMRKLLLLLPLFALVLVVVLLLEQRFWELRLRRGGERLHRLEWAASLLFRLSL
jgi:hypothetical protein